MIRGKQGYDKLIDDLANCVVEEMNDGGMGSLSFVNETTPHLRFGQEIGEADFDDADGVLVSVTLNLDQNGDLFELDVWKVDNSPLKRFPPLTEIRLRR
ncbi:hypothetical protein TSO221_21870 [Azospirillum sp. TSO22-1]|nr:hypothetical protein TSO221_21870 [Azospirillum sp. TSO22-1]